MSSIETLKRYGYQVSTKESRGLSVEVSKRTKLSSFRGIRSSPSGLMFHQNVIYCELWNGGKNFVVTLGDNKEDLMAIYTDLHEKFC